MMRSRSRLLIFLLSLCGVFVFGLLPLSGCGSAGGTSATVNTSGRAQLTFRWPERTTRLIPFASNSIRVRLVAGSQLLGEALLVRPTNGGLATISFDRLPLGPATVEATAYPGADGSGVAQATATIVANQIAEVRLTLASTIVRVEVSPSTASLNVGQTVQLSATAKNAAGETVLTALSAFACTSDNTAVATAAAGGLVMATGVGTANITVTETESGQVGTVAVTVTATNPPLTGQMYVTSIFNHSVKIYDVATGAYVRDFIPTGTGMERPQAIVFGPDNLVYISHYAHKISRFNATTGAFVDEFIPSGSGGIDNAVGFIFGKDGNLLVCSAWTSQVKKFNAQTGAYMGDFISGNGLNLAHDLVFGPDGKLYLCSSWSHEIKRYDPDTGAFLNNFVTSRSGGLSDPNHLVFGPDGHLYVTSWGTHEVKKYNGTKGHSSGTSSLLEAGE
jgi:streptogramin lyase